jgi:hypothetical protein
MERIEKRICSHCGKVHTEGWYLSELDNAYACSDECAMAIYQAHGQGKEEFDYDVMYELSGWCETILG